MFCIKIKIYSPFHVKISVHKVLELSNKVIYKFTPKEDPKRFFNQILESYGGCSPPNSEGRISFGKYSCRVFKFRPCIII